MADHPAFERARALSEPLRSHFPKSREEALSWEPKFRWIALSRRVLVVAATRVECAWKAYIDAVPGDDHKAEYPLVLAQGVTLPEAAARALFPGFSDVPYAK